MDAPEEYYVVGVCDKCGEVVSTTITSTNIRVYVQTSKKSVEARLNKTQLLITVITYTL